MAENQTTPAPAEVDDRVDLWHEGCALSGWSLQDALGMTDAEYEVWMRDASAIPSRPLPKVRT